MAMVALAAAVVAFSFQQTVVVPAIPTVARELEASGTWAAWLLSGYLVASAVATPLLGKLGDRYGKRRILMVSLWVFLAGSIFAAFAASIEALIAARLVQGAGGAVFPLALAISRDELPREAARPAIGVLTATFGIGASLGVGLSGALVEALSWRAIFVAGAAVVVVALVTVPLGVPHTPARSHSRLDLPGAALLSGGLAGVLIALTEGERMGWLAPPLLAVLAAGVALLGWWVARSLRAPEPLIDLRMLAARPVLLTNVATLLLGATLFGVYLLVPYLVGGSGEDGYGFAAGPLEAGLYLLPAALGQVVAGPAAGVWAARADPRWPFAAGVALTAAGSAALALAHDAPWQVLGATFVVGAGIGAGTGVGSALMAQAVSESDSGVATAINSVARRVGGAIGGQLGAALLAGATLASGAPSEGAFVAAFLAAAALGAVAAALALGVRTGAGRAAAAPG